MQGEDLESSSTMALGCANKWKIKYAGGSSLGKGNHLLQMQREMLDYSYQLLRTQCILCVFFVCERSGSL